MDRALDAVRARLEADARSWAAQVRATAQLLRAARTGGGADRAFVELEIAGSWSVSQATATRLLVEAEQLTDSLPATLALLERGELLVHQARVLLHVTRNASSELARLVELEVLTVDDLAGTCPADLRALATRVLLRLEAEAASDSDQDPAEGRHALAAAARRTWTSAEPDGMGAAGAVLTAEQLAGWTAGMDALEAQDRAADRDAGVVRTADQRRADLFAALPGLVLAARAGELPLSSASVRLPVVLTVHVPLATVLGVAHQPGHLEGYGPVGAEHVRLLRPVAYRRLLVDADSGRPVQLDDRLTPLPDDPTVAQEQLSRALRAALVTTTVLDPAEPQHDPSARLARLVDVRDRRCSGPGCGQTRTHRDHADPWPIGPTAAWNLQRLSARCHRAKHAGWHVRGHDDGSATWSSPLGRTYRRPSPHSAPPAVDLTADPPPRRPPPPPPPADHRRRSPSSRAWATSGHRHRPPDGRRRRSAQPCPTTRPSEERAAGVQRPCRSGSAAPWSTSCGGLCAPGRSRPSAWPPGARSGWPVRRRSAVGQQLPRGAREVGVVVEGDERDAAAAGHQRGDAAVDGHAVERHDTVGAVPSSPAQIAATTPPEVKTTASRPGRGSRSRTSARSAAAAPSAKPPSRRPGRAPTRRARRRAAPAPSGTSRPTARPWGSGAAGRGGRTRPTAGRPRAGCRAARAARCPAGGAGPRRRETGSRRPRRTSSTPTTSLWRRPTSDSTS